MFTGYASYVIYWGFDGCIYGDFLVKKRDVCFFIISSQNIDGGYMLESEAVLTSTHDLRF